MRSLSNKFTSLPSNISGQPLSANHSFKEERVTTIGLYDIGKSHDPGIQQEPLGIENDADSELADLEMETRPEDVLAEIDCVHRQVKG